MGITSIGIILISNILLQNQFSIFSEAPSVNKNSVVFTVDSQSSLETFEVTGRWPEIQVFQIIFNFMFF